MTYEEFKEDVLNGIKAFQNNWRKGQKVFNYIDAKYRVARTVQFEKGVDCFYNNNQIDKFIEESFKLIK